MVVAPEEIVAMDRESKGVFASNKDLVNRVLVKALHLLNSTGILDPIRIYHV